MDINSGVKLVPKWTIKKLFLGESTKKGSCHLCKTSNFIPNSYSDLFSFLRRDPILAWEIYLGPEHVSHLFIFLLRKNLESVVFNLPKDKNWIVVFVMMVVILTYFVTEIWLSFDYICSKKIQT